MIQILLAQSQQNLGTLKGLGPLGEVNQTNAPGLFAKTISLAIGFMTIVAAIWFLFNIIISGYQWLSSGGDKQKLSEAQSKLTNSIVGLVIVVIAIFVTRLVVELLGIPNLLDPTVIINQILLP